MCMLSSRFKRSPINEFKFWIELSTKQYLILRSSPWRHFQTSLLDSVFTASKMSLKYIFVVTFAVQIEITLECELRRELGLDRKSVSNWDEAIRGNS